MRKIRILDWIGCCSAVGCTLSEPYQLAYSDCMDGLLVYEAALVGPQGKVFYKGVENSAYCWQLVHERTRELEQRGLL